MECLMRCVVNFCAKSLQSIEVLSYSIPLSYIYFMNIEIERIR
jgi:hypothetical protein